jgi:hypothetical protein
MFNSSVELEVTERLWTKNRERYVKERFWFFPECSQGQKKIMKTSDIIVGPLVDIWIKNLLNTKC